MYRFQLAVSAAVLGCQPALAAPYKEVTVSGKYQTEIYWPEESEAVSPAPFELRILIPLSKFTFSSFDDAEGYTSSLSSEIEGPFRLKLGSITYRASGYVSVGMQTNFVFGSRDESSYFAAATVRNMKMDYDWETFATNQCKDGKFDRPGFPMNCANLKKLGNFDQFDGNGSFLTEDAFEVRFLPWKGYTASLNKGSPGGFVHNWCFDSIELESCLGGSGLRLDIDKMSITPGIPEPESWTMWIAGFGLLGAALRKSASGRTAAF